MNYRTTVALETLESRTLFSGTPSATILADQAAITTAKDQLAADKTAGKQTVLADKLQLMQDQSTKSNTLAPLQLQLQTDIGAENAALRTDAKNALTTRIADFTAIRNDYIKLLGDLGNTSAENADHAQLNTDQATLQSDNTAAKVTASDTRSTYRTIILNDRLAITNARVGNDPTINNDKIKLLNDQLAEANTILADKEAITSAELKLAQDQAAGA